MDQNQNNDFPWREGQEEPQNDPPHEPIDLRKLKKEKKRLSLGIVALIVCVATVVSVMTTYTLTSALWRTVYVSELQKKQEEIQKLEATLDVVNAQDGSELGKLKLLSKLFETSSYYADKVSEEDRLEAVLKAYAESTGDDYAEYYTEEEYAQILENNVGNHVGIGVSVIQTELTVDGYSYQVFEVISVFRNSPAEKYDVQVGDCIYAIKSEDSFLTISQLGGYTQALNAMRGEIGSEAQFLVFRKDGTSYSKVEFSVKRDTYVEEAVTYTTAEEDPTIGIVKIHSFNLTTPSQLKEAMKSLSDKGAEKYVFDVRNNPGGDLISIKAVLSYFLHEGDLILSSVDSDGNVAESYYAEPMEHLSGDYASCKVYKSELGMYRDLEMVVLCNGNTASAAEVFTATLRDYDLAPVVGETTFGKGIMQSIISLSSFSGGMYDGYVKMTTYAYVTKCGVTYHEIGVKPTVGDDIPLEGEALEYSLYVLPQSLDNQLKAAIGQLTK